MTARKPSKSTRLLLDRLKHNLYHLDQDTISQFDLKRQIPNAWATLENDIDVEERRVKVTLLLDESVAKFYRGMGKGYQRRINRVLGTYAQMRICDLTETYRQMLEDGLYAPVEFGGTLRRNLLSNVGQKRTDASQPGTLQIQLADRHPRHAIRCIGSICFIPARPHNESQRAVHWIRLRAITGHQWLCRQCQFDDGHHHRLGDPAADIQMSVQCPEYYPRSVRTLLVGTAAGLSGWPRRE